MTDGHHPLRGRKLADRRVHVERPHSAYFRYSAEGQLVAKQAASQPTTPTGRLFARIKAMTLGRPLANEQEIEERLPKKKALAIFSSDAISSSAYATEEILKVLIAASAAGALAYSVHLSVAIAVLLAVVSLSYRQVCRAYPNGGGAYVVARENLSQLLGLVAAAALLIDYVMTVAVSTASAIEQLQSIAPAVYDYRIEIAFVSISLITIGNLRGLRESGNIFAIPTYAFVGLALLMVGVGLFRIATGNVQPFHETEVFQAPAESFGLFLLLKAFAGGSVALTGVEAIANGVPAFKPPESRNAANTLTAMSILLGILFIGITLIAHAFNVLPSAPGGASVVALVAEAVFGSNSLFLPAFAISTALILFLAANTSFNAFPRLAAILATDEFMPRQFGFRGDRLAYSWGIVLLAAIAFSLLWVFGGDTHALIPLYSVGVFVCFTLSQIGMVKHWAQVRERGWHWRAAVNAFGAVLTAVVFAVVVYVKFPEGAWLVVVLVPTLVAMMLFINRQYRASRQQLALRPDYVARPPHRQERVIVPIPGVNRAVITAVNVGRSISQDVRAVFVSDDADESDRVRKEWARRIPDVPLVVVESPYRALISPLVAYLDVLDKGWPDEKEAPITFVVIPEYVARTWWERILYNQSAKRLRTALLGRPHTVVVNVPYRRDERGQFIRPPDAANVVERQPGFRRTEVR